MTSHLYVEEFFSSIVAQVLLQASYKLELLLKKPHGSDRETCPPCGRNVITASFRLVFSSTGNMERQNTVLKFKLIQGSFGLFIH